MYRVILVDDEALIRQGIKKILDRFAPQWEVVGEAEDGISGMQQILRLQPDLAILDVRMPGLTGIECCQQIAAQAPRIHRIILTAYQDFQLAKQAIDYGVKAFITKPLDREELLRTLAAVEAHVEEERQGQEELRSLKQAVQQVAPLAERIYYQQFMFGNDSTELEQLLIRSGVAMPFREEGARIVLLALSPDWLEQGAFSPFDTELFRYALVRFVQEWLNGRFRSVVVQDQAGQIITILSFGREETDTALEQAAELAQDMNSAVKDYFKRTATVGISRLHSLAGCSRAYEEASLAVTYRMVSGGGQVLSLEALHADQEMPIALLEQLEASLEQLMQGNEQGALLQLEAAIASGRLSPAELKRMVVHYVLRLAVQIKQMELDMEAISGQPLQVWLAELEGAVTRTSLMDRLSAMIRQLCASIQHERQLLDTSQIEKAKQYVIDYLDAGVSLQSVADYLGMNASYFSRWFKYSTNGNFVDFLKECRIERAKELLRGGGHTLQEISGQVGYADTKHFCRVFKELTGQSPSEYKKQA